MKKGLFLSDFLEIHRISKQDLISAVKGRVRERANVAFVSGSLLEGFGTPHSDIDVYVLAEEIPNEERRIDVLKCRDATVDLEWWRLEDVCKLVAQLERMPSTQSRDPRDTLSFSPYERELLHRLLIGRPLLGHGTIVSLQNLINPASLARLLLDRALIRINNAHLDIIGLIENEDYETVSLVCQLLADQIVDALLSATGNTNPEEKWRLAKLRQLDGTDWDRDLPGGQLTQSAAKTYCALRFREIVMSDQIADHAWECVRFANRIIPWAQERFLRGYPLTPVRRRTDSAQFMPGRAQIDCGSRVTQTHPVAVHTDDSVMPRLSLKGRVCYEHNGLKLFGMASDCAWDINRLTQEALLLFDGRTTISAAVRTLNAFTGAEDEAIGQAIYDLCNVMSVNGMLDNTRPTTFHITVAAI